LKDPRATSSDLVWWQTQVPIFSLFGPLTPKASELNKNFSPTSSKILKFLNEVYGLKILEPFDL
jgi:hypothetical protein